MRKHNAENERVKRDYLRWLKGSQGRSEQTLDIAAAAINRFEAQTGYRPFKSFRRDQAINFKEHLGTARHAVTGKPLAKATTYGTLKSVQAFFEWLSREPGYRSHVHISDAAYFRPTDNDARIATARRDRPAPSLEQVQHVLSRMPIDTTVQRRDRAVVGLILLTGARDAAVASLRIKHLDLDRRQLIQDAREVKTKRAKTFTTTFFPVGDVAVEAVATWVAELKTDLLYGPDDPLFPATKNGLDEAGLFAPVGVERSFWSTAAPIRELFRRAFLGAGLPYYGPHSLRRTLTALAYDLNLGTRDLKAWSQNLGHESVLTTLGSYGTLSPSEQSSAILSIGPVPKQGMFAASAAELARLVLSHERSHL